MFDHSPHYVVVGLTYQINFNSMELKNCLNYPIHTLYTASFKTHVYLVSLRSMKSYDFAS